MSIDIPDLWSSLAILTATCRVLSIFWEPSPPGFVKVNVDSSGRDRRGGADFVIYNPDERLLVAGVSHLFEPSVPTAELYTTWAGVTFARQQFHAKRIFLEGDSTTIISWFQRDARQLKGHPLIQDV